MADNLLHMKWIRSYQFIPLKSQIIHTCSATHPVWKCHTRKTSSNAHWRKRETSKRFWYSSQLDFIKIICLINVLCAENERGEGSLRCSTCECAWWTTTIRCVCCSTYSYSAHMHTHTQFGLWKWWKFVFHMWKWIASVDFVLCV